VVVEKRDPWENRKPTEGKVTRYEAKKAGS